MHSKHTWLIITVSALKETMYKIIQIDSFLREREQILLTENLLTTLVFVLTRE